MPLRRPAAWCRLLLPLALLLSLAAPAAVAETDLSGVWEVEGTTRAYGHFRFFVRVEPQGDGFVATKISPSRFVPANRRHFIGRVRGDSLEARVQVALPRFDQPEWHEHRFELVRDDAGGVSRMVLVTGESVAETGGGTVADQWRYVRWPGTRYRLRTPSLSLAAYESDRMGARADLAHLEREIALVDETLADYRRRSDEARRRMAALAPEVERRRQAYDAAREAWAAARRAEPEGPADVAPEDLPAPLRTLQRQRQAARAEAERLKQRILDLRAGRLQAGPNALTALFDNLDATEASLRRIESAIARRRAELGLEPERPADPAQRQRRLAALEQAFDAAGDALLAAEQAHRRPVSELKLVAGLVEAATREREEKERRRQALLARLKFLDRDQHLARIEVRAGLGAAARTVMEVAPSGLDKDLRALKAALDEVGGQAARLAAVRADIRRNFEARFDEVTALRDSLRRMIWRNALEMAALEAVTKLGEYGVSFATGGPVGLAVDMVSTPLFQFALHDDGVVFENYDEGALQRAYRQAVERQEDAAPDPEESCKVAQEKVRTALSYGAMRAMIDASAGPAHGNRAQRLPNAAVHALQALHNLGADAAVQMRFDAAVRGQQQALEELVRRRAAAAGGETLARLGAIAREVADESLDIASRTAAATRFRRLLGNLAGPDAGSGPARQTIEELARLGERLAAAERLAAQGATEGERVAARRAQQRLLASMARRQGEGLRALADGSAHIDWDRALLYARDVQEQITRETAKLARLETRLAQASKGGAKGTAASVAVGLVFSLAKDANMQRLQRQERALWERVFQIEIEQSVRFRAWGHANCLYWAAQDHHNRLRRHYMTLYNAYDPETGFRVLAEDAFFDHERLDVRLVYDPPAAQRLTVEIGGVACRQDRRAGCAMPAGALAGRPGPYLDFEIAVAPPTGG